MTYPFQQRECHLAAPIPCRRGVHPTRVYKKRARLNDAVSIHSYGFLGVESAWVHNLLFFC